VERRKLISVPVYLLFFYCAYMKTYTHFDIYKYKIIFTNKIFKVSNVVLIVDDCSYFNEDLNSFFKKKIEDLNGFLIDNINVVKVTQNWRYWSFGICPIVVRWNYIVVRWYWSFLDVWFWKNRSTMELHRSTMVRWCRKT